MPDLDFMIAADYVRAEGGVLHMIAAGFDTIFVSSAPSTRPVGIGIRLHLTLAETRHQHEVELLFQDADGTRLAQITGTFPPIPDNQPPPPPGRPVGVVIPFNLQVPLPRFGDYSFELLVDRVSKKSIPIAVVRPPVLHSNATLPDPPSHA